MNKLLVAVLLAGASTFAHAADARPLTIRDVVAMDRVSDPQISPDGRYVAYTLRVTDLAANKGVRSVWLLDLKTRATRTFSGGSGNSDTPRWSPDGKTLYFLSNRSGSQQVWKLDLGGGDAQAVTVLPLDVGTYLVSPTGKHLALAIDVFTDCDTLDCTRQRLDEKAAAKNTGLLYDKLFVRHWDTWKNGTRSQLFTAALGADGKAATPLLVSRGIDGDVPSKPFGDDAEITWTPDGRTLIFSARIAGKTEAWSTNFDLFEAPADGSTAPKNLTADNPASDTGPVVSPDGRYLAYRAMKRPGFEADRYAILLRDLDSGATREVAADWDRSAESLTFSADGRYLYTVADDLGQHRLFAISFRSGTVSRLSDEGKVSGYSVGEDGIVYALESLASPAQLWQVGLNGRGERQLTQHNDQRLKGIEMAAYKQFSFRGWNDETVYGYVMQPANFEAGRKYPVAFIIHGGPQGSMGNDFHYRWNPQLFAGMGYAVVFIDFHGSTGYGQAFTDSISGDWGGKPLEDLQKGWKAALAKYDYLDGDKACALGASYGGYMVNWIAGNWKDGFKCLVNHDGVFDSRMMSYSTEELWFDEWEHGGTQYDKPENFERHNPVNHVAQWSTPMLVVQGGLDFRISLEQGLGTFTALQRRGIPSQFLYFPDENHWVLKPQNSIQWYDTVEAWMKRWLN